MIDRDCDNCSYRYYSDTDIGIIGQCEEWVCDFNPKNYQDFICNECKHLTMFYDKHDWEIYACGHEDGRGTDDPYETACKYFEISEEARKEYFKGVNDESKA